MQGGKVADQVILEKSSATTLMRSFFEKLSGNKRDCVCAVDVISRLHNFMEAGNKKLKPDVEVGVRLMLALDDGCTRKLTYTEFVHFLLCFLHAYGERFSDLLPALIHSSPERDDSKLFCRYSLPAEVKGHAFSDGRLSCIYNVLEQRDGSAAGRLVLALKRFQPACAPAAVPCVRGDPLGPLSSCEQMSREKFLSMVAAITRSDSEKHQLADFISAYIACGDVLGFNAESVKILADISQAKTHSLAHMDGLRKIQLPRTWSDGEGAAMRARVGTGAAIPGVVLSFPLRWPCLRFSACFGSPARRRILGRGLVSRWRRRTTGNSTWLLGSLASQEPVDAAFWPRA
mmetsp:Transcript_35843/g.84950  ORF Transcript_35843/g.84950 Transcript_35843/m.84950 type:complete len:345 (-) Transcript_35843:1676-2710(-)